MTCDSYTLESGWYYPPEFGRRSPVRTAGGVFYHILVDNATRRSVVCRRSTDLCDLLLTLPDSSNSPTPSGTLQVSSLDYYLDGSVIHVVYSVGDGFTEGLEVYYARFDTSTDTWTAGGLGSEELIHSHVSGAQAYRVSVVPRSDGTVTAFFPYRVTYMSGKYTHVGYNIRSAGGTWGTAAQFDDAAVDENQRVAFAVRGVSDHVHVFYDGTTVSGNTRQRTLTASDTLQSSSYDTGRDAYAASAQPVITGSLVEVGVSSQSFDPCVLSFTSSADPVSFSYDVHLETTITNVVTFMETSAGDRYLVWLHDTSPAMLAYKVDSGSGWGSRIEIPVGDFMQDYDLVEVSGSLYYMGGRIGVSSPYYLYSAWDALPPPVTVTEISGGLVSAASVFDGALTTFVSLVGAAPQTVSQFGGNILAGLFRREGLSDGYAVTGYPALRSALHYTLVLSVPALDDLACSLQSFTLGRSRVPAGSRYRTGLRCLFTSALDTAGLQAYAGGTATLTAVEQYGGDSVATELCAVTIDSIADQDVNWDLALVTLYGSDELPLVAGTLRTLDQALYASITQAAVRLRAPVNPALLPGDVVQWQGTELPVSAVTVYGSASGTFMEVVNG